MWHAVQIVCTTCQKECKDYSAQSAGLVRHFSAPPNKIQAEASLPSQAQRSWTQAACQALQEAVAWLLLLGPVSADAEKQ